MDISNKLIIVIIIFSNSYKYYIIMFIYNIMVTKMKMFGFMPPRVNSASIQSSTTTTTTTTIKANPTHSSSSNFNMKNLASIMNVKNTGCKSCRG